MKFISLGKIFFAALLVTLSLSSAKAQSPAGQFGVGIVTASGAFGGQVQYAITPAFHIGTQFGFKAISSGGTSTNQVLFAPYGKFLFAGTAAFKPFVMARFGLLSSAQTETSLIFSGGAEYFASRNLGVFGGIDVISLGLSPAPTTTVIGIGEAFLGVEWFF